MEEQVIELNELKIQLEKDKQNEVTIAVNAPPMMTPTAISITLPLRANALKS